jgi:hypothetical protein
MGQEVLRKGLGAWLTTIVLLMESDRRHPPENGVIDQLAKILRISPDVLYFYAHRLLGDVMRDFDECSIEAGYRAFRNTLQECLQELANLTPKRGRAAIKTGRGNPAGNPGCSSLSALCPCKLRPGSLKNT